MVTAFASALALATLLSACATPGLQSEVPESESAWQQLAFPELYDQQLEWQTCGVELGFVPNLEEMILEQGGRVEGVRCSTITAPLDWDAPENSETIDLAVVHIPATGEKPIGTLLSNPGGPGASGIDFALGLTFGEAFAAVQEQYDLLGFDPRGIGRSAPLDCQPDTDIFELQLTLCADENPLALSMGSAQVARDMELMRHLMGDESMHYAGFSYGTVIGASYVTLFPEKIGRVMLDSAWPTNWSSPLGTYLQAEAISHSIVEMLAGCAIEYAVTQCPISGEESLTQTLRTLDDNPLRATDGTEVTGTTMNGYLTTALYNRYQGRHDVLDVAGRALSGEQEAIDQLAAAMADGGMKVDLSGMVVRCLSSPNDADLIGLYDYINEHGLPLGIGGPEINDETLRPFFDLKCAALPDSGKDYMKFTNSGETPVLVFGITGDHATPYEGAQQLVDELGNATLVTLEGTGHIATYGGRSRCADDIATAYLLEGKLPLTGTVCKDD